MDVFLNFDTSGWRGWADCTWEGPPMVGRRRKTHGRTLKCNATAQDPETALSLGVGGQH
jgi:hypothetical protein